MSAKKFWLKASANFQAAAERGDTKSVNEKSEKVFGSKELIICLRNFS